MCSDWEEEQEIVTPAQTACERACLRPSWRGRRHFHKADCLPILSLFNKASVCVCGLMHSISALWLGRMLQLILILPSAVISSDRLVLQRVICVIHVISLSRSLAGVNICLQEYV